ncbi:Orn/Lys/Arg decarboxylase major region [Gloeothece citriformis PCC 7424]|uniref:Orn/Lys/Arg decarboxylase major region n=1 Tax=Gloeothece citriformis (strain PCC 7424) TaxID=65393 RepID=B7KFA8_GLOC7|nr:aminotransferase class I/II-fold pyridoxal phosphate-dependent enzyme [Gloeothece citriformis]ACK71824.1 Orn/Lys/Arg decarboxylase major region [Gloeothece citriformis PCC 7424]
MKSLDSFFKSQSQTPIIETLASLINKPDAAFYTPGHKRGQGSGQNLVNLLGSSVFRADLPELPELDHLFAPEGVIHKAQSLAAEAFGSAQTWFLVNGSTCGIMAAILATCQKGDKIILPRNIHQSAIAGLIVSGAVPIFVNPAYNPIDDLTYSITPEGLETALQENPDTKAVMIVYPTYQGICGDLEALISLTHRHNIPFLVDEAHGGHFAFHSLLPPSALSLGADLTIQSTHKVLGSFTQSSMLHLQGDLVNPQRITKALQLLQSSSPSYLLLASLDGARQQMALEGHQILTKTLQLAEIAREQLSQISGLSVLTLDNPRPEFRWLDITRLTVNVAQLGLTGYEVDEMLRQQMGVTAELPLLKHLTFIITFGNTQEDITKLVQGFAAIASSSSFNPLRVSVPFPLSDTPMGISPRDAFFRPTETLDIDQSVGYISAELVCPYPPGIPVLMPGEKITPQAVAYLQQVLSLGAMITGCSDPTLKTLNVVRF